MKLNLRAFSMTAGIITAAIILITGMANLAWRGYADVFFKLMASIYPGYDASGTFGDLMVGTLYGLVDGFVFGWVFGWLYNRLAAKQIREAVSEHATDS
jgi:hypothetical protein